MNTQQYFDFIVRPLATIKQVDDLLNDPAVRRKREDCDILRAMWLEHNRKEAK